MSQETKLAMFCAALAAQCAGEQVISARRVVAALLQADSVREFCAGAGIDREKLLETVEDSPAASEHPAAIVPRPLEPSLRPVFDAVFERPEQLGIPPLELLREVLKTDPVLAEQLAPLT